MSQNITRAEARERAAGITAQRYAADLDLTAPGDTFSSTTTVTFDATVPSTWLDLIAPRVRRVTLNGAELDVAVVVRDSRIHLDGLAAQFLLHPRVNRVGQGCRQS